MSEYYSHTAYPIAGSRGTSVLMRSELEAIEAGFTKLPTLSASAGKFVAVNEAGTVLVGSDLISYSGTTLTLGGTLEGAGITSLFAAPPAAIGGTTPVAGTFTTCTATTFVGDAATQANGNSTTKLATTAFVQTAVAGVSGSGMLALVVSSEATVTAVSGQHILLTRAGAQNVVLPAAPADGAAIAVTVRNERTDNTVDFNGKDHMDTTYGADPTMILDGMYTSLTLRWSTTDNAWSIL
jgi:hypothetical protein